MQDDFGKQQGLIAGIHTSQILVDFRTQLHTKEKVVDVPSQARLNFPGP